MVVKFYLVILDFSHMVFQNIIVASLEIEVVVRKVFFVMIIDYRWTTINIAKRQNELYTEPAISGPRRLFKLVKRT